MHRNGIDRSLCRLRGADCARKHHPAAEDHRPRHRRHNASERTVAVKKGDTFGSSCANSALRRTEIKAILAVLGSRGRDDGLQDGHKLRILLSPATAPERACSRSA